MKILSIYLEPGNNSSLLKRLDALGDIVKAKKPEFVALQNVTNDIIKKMKVTPWGARFNILQTPYSYETRKNATSALLSTYPTDGSLSRNYKHTQSGKMILNGLYVMYDKQKQPFVITVGATTLEQGLKASEFRDKQLNEACLSMAEAKDSFLTGGFNIDSDIDGELLLQGGWKDAWLEAGHTESSGYTYDPDKNPLIKEDPFGPGRPDRLLYRTRHYKLDSVELVGNKHPSAASAAASSTISTHYGILAQFSPLEIPEPPIKDSPIVSAIFKHSEWSVQFQEAKKKKEVQEKNEVEQEKEEVKEEEEKKEKSEWSVQFQASD